MVRKLSAGFMGAGAAVTGAPRCALGVDVDGRAFTGGGVAADAEDGTAVGDGLGDGDGTTADLE